MFHVTTNVFFNIDTYFSQAYLKIDQGNSDKTNGILKLQLSNLLETRCLLMHFMFVKFPV